MIDRLKGREVAVQIFVDGKPADTLGPFLNLDIEFKREVADQEYLGEAKPWPFGFGTVNLEFKAQAVSPGFLAMVAELAKQGRAEYQRALAEHILAGGWVGCIVLPGDTHPDIYLARVLRMVAAPAALGCSITQELYRASFDDGYNPDPEAQRKALHGARLSERPPLPTPTLDEVLDQLAHSKHPWVAMDIGGPSGCVDTIIYPKGRP